MLLIQNNLFFIFSLNVIFQWCKTLKQNVIVAQSNNMDRIYSHMGSCYGAAPLSCSALSDKILKMITFKP